MTTKPTVAETVAAHTDLSPAMAWLQMEHARVSGRNEAQADVLATIIEGVAPYLGAAPISLGKQWAIRAEMLKNVHRECRVSKTKIMRWAESNELPPQLNRALMAAADSYYSRQAQKLARECDWIAELVEDSRDGKQ